MPLVCREGESVSMSEAAAGKVAIGLAEKAKTGLLWLLVALALLEPLQYLHLTFLEFSSGDEGLLLAAALRVLHGQVPYRDFPFILMPGSLYLSAIWLFIFGPTLVAARWLAWLVNVLLVSGLGLLGWKARFSRTSLILLFLAQVALGFYVWPILSYHWIVNACLVLSAYCLMASGGGESLGWLFLAGMLAGAGTLMLQDEGGYWGLLIVLVLVVVGGRRKWRKEGLFMLGGLFVIAPVVLYLTVKHAFPHMLFDTLLGPYMYYHDNPVNQVTWGYGWLENFRRLPASWKTGPLWFASDLGAGIANVWVFLVFPLALALASWRATRLRSLTAEERWQWAVLLCVMGALLLMALHKPATLVLMFASPGPLLVVLWEWERLQRKRPWLAAWLAGVGVALPLAITAVATSLPHPYLAPRSNFDFPAGRVKTEEMASVPSWTLLHEFQTRYLKPGQSVFCYDYCSFYSFVLRAVGPTRYDNFDVGRLDPAMVHDLLAHLAAKPPDWILLDGRYGPDDPVVAWISLHYRPLARCTGLLIVGRGDLGAKPPAGQEGR